MWTKLVWPPSSHLYHDCLMSKLCTNLVPEKQSTKDNKIYNLLKTLKRNCVWQRSSLMRVTMLNRSYVPSSCPFSNISHSLNQRKLMKCTSTFSLAGYSWFNWGKNLLEEVTSNKLYNYKRKPYHRWCIFKNEPFQSLNEPKRNYPLQYQSER